MMLIVSGFQADWTEAMRNILSIVLRKTCWLPLTLSVAPFARPAEQDILIADFEGKDYGEWKTTGEAFGSGPARGTLPGQMPVDGFEGHGLVNSFYGGDSTIGTLSSPSFRIER